MSRDTSIGLTCRLIEIARKLDLSNTFADTGTPQLDKSCAAKGR